MNLFSLLSARVADKGPVKVGLIGAGKFGAMFLAQAARTPGLEVAAIADLNPQGAKARCMSIGWDDQRIGRTRFVESLDALLEDESIEVVVEATGDPLVGTVHAEAVAAAGRHIVMVNVEADVLVGPMLAKQFQDKGLVYSLAYGDQPALICEMVDWARATGFEVVAAGKGTKYLSTFHASTPETVWGHYGMTPEDAKAGGLNPQMFNSFLDGTKSAIEMAAVANATGLAVPKEGLAFPPVGTHALARDLRPQSAGGLLPLKGQVEVISSLERDGSEVKNDLRWGVYVVIEAPNDYVARCFREYGLAQGAEGRYAAMYKPFHLIGLELGISVLSAALRGEATGCPQSFAGDVASTAKTDLAAGTLLDGEGGYCVWGRLMRAEDSKAVKALPIGLAKGAKLTRAVKAGEVVSLDGVELPPSRAGELRRAMLGN